MHEVAMFDSRKGFSAVRNTSLCDLIFWGAKKSPNDCANKAGTRIALSLALLCAAPGSSSAAQQPTSLLPTGCTKGAEGQPSLVNWPQPIKRGAPPRRTAGALPRAHLVWQAAGFHRCRGCRDQPSHRSASAHQNRQKNWKAEHVAGQVLQETFAESADV